MLILTLILFPFLTGILLLGSRQSNARPLALLSSLVSLGLAIACWVAFKNHQNDLLTFKTPWIPGIGSSFFVSLDGISLLLVTLTNFLLPFIIFSSLAKDHKNPRVFYGLISFMQFALLGVFSAMDGLLFYVFWELALIPIWFICLLWGEKDSPRITLKFFIYTLAGSLFMLIGLLFVYQFTQNNGAKSFHLSDLYQAGATLTAGQQTFVFWCLFLAFAVKMPVFPFHTWQPDTYTSAPTAGTMLLSGIMLKMGTYGVLRWLLPMVPTGTSEWASVAIGLSVAGIIYASCLALVQKDFKRLIAYSSIAHVGLISAGMFSMTAEGLSGSVIQMLSHGVNVVALFFICDLLMEKTGTRIISELGGLRTKAPVFAVFFLIVLLGSVALPLTNGFVGEFLLLTGLFQYSFWAAALAGLTVVLGAVYMLRSYQGIMLGAGGNKSETFTEAGKKEWWVLLPLAMVVLFFGIYPAPLLEVIQAPVQELFELINAGIK